MPIYDTIKAQEAHFPIPTPSATITVGTFNAVSGDFQYAVPTYSKIVVTPADPHPGGNLKPTRETIVGGDVHAVNVYGLRLRFNVTGRQGSFSVYVPGTPAVQAAANSVEVDVGTANSVTFTLACNGNEFSPELPLTITRHIIAAGAITIPALPVTIIYAPPVDQQKKNVASWTATDVTGNTTTVSFSDQYTTTVPVPSPFRPWLELTGEMKIASTILGKVPNAIAQAVGGVLGVISGLLGTSVTTGSSGTTVLDQQTLTLTLSAQDTVITNPNGGGPGSADVLYFLKNAKLCWFTNGGPIQLALLGWDAEDTLTASLLQNQNPPVPTGLEQATRDALLKLDPFVAGGPAALLPPPRFQYIDTFDVNATHIYNLSYTITNTDLLQNVRTETSVEDDTASFLAFANIGVTQTVKAQSILTQTSAAQTTTTKTITRQVQFFANPTEYYSVEVYCDVIFGTFAFRSVGSSAGPVMVGRALDKLGKPLALSEVTLLSNGKHFRTISDANGNFSFRAATIQPGKAQIATRTAKQNLDFAGTPLRNLKIKG